jgi:hypothetical protein
MNKFRKFGLGLAVVFTAMLVFSCGGAVGGGGGGSDDGGDPTPSDGVKLEALDVYYNGTEPESSLIGFNPSNQRFTKEIAAESGHDYLIVSATAISETAEIEISWANGSNSDSTNEKQADTNTVELSNVYIPVSGDKDTVIKVKVTNGADEFTFEVKVTPPTVDTTLKNLSVSYTPGGANLITNFSPNIFRYSIFVDNNTRTKVYIDATAGEGLTIDCPPDVNVPAAGSQAVLITVTVIF